jgi:hypothetical protein
VTFADSVLHLVRSGARIDQYSGSRATAGSVAGIAELEDLDEYEDMEAAALATEASPASPTLELAQAMAEPAAEYAPIAGEPAEFAFDPEAAESHEFEPGLQDLEAAVVLVSDGLAKRVVLSGFQSWPGLLWRAYQLAESAHVVILPTVVRPGGRVDIVISRENGANG